jgi:MoaA/NifB/PqqE/SkfB family radical SAM enzyme
MDPPRMDIRTGYLCNNNCRFCCVRDLEKNCGSLTTGDIKRDLDFARKEGVQKVVFTGGEPTIRKDILELVKYARSLQFNRIALITNGRMLSYKDFVDRLVKAGMTDVAFSLPDYRQSVYEHLTRVRGSFEQLMRGIYNTKGYNLSVATITVILKTNFKHLVKLTEFLIVLNAHFPDFFSEFIFVNPESNAWRYRKEMVPKMSDVVPYVHESLDVARRSGLKLNIEGIPFCYMEKYKKNIVELGMAKKRIMTSPGFLDVDYNKTRREKLKYKGQKCKICKYGSICEGVWENYVKIYGFNEFMPL